MNVNYCHICSFMLCSYENVNEDSVKVLGNTQSSISADVLFNDVLSDIDWFSFESLLALCKLKGSNTYK